METVEKTRVATIWLSGCSGCHMSFLDQDELLIDLAKKVKLVYSPIADVKVFPENVDVTLIEGAVANEEQLSLLKRARERTKILISLGDCAVTGNVTALRNAWENSDQAILQRAYIENANVNQQIPTDVPKLLKKVHPLHEVVKVDYFIPGCPPSAGLINYVLTELLAGRTPNMEGRSKYG
ncbi:oxidoreductase [Candidatus Bathyarchaeota archaeon A05DMB-2]|jgi:NAD-reducing hydrogenase small subunit|nr:oxidoreductase [Candidatus Bathyarchaeota archaeon A05DMB-2]